MIRGDVIEPAIRLGIEVYTAAKSGNQRVGTLFLQAVLLTVRLSLPTGPELYS